MTNKEKFINYCKGKIEDLGEIQFYWDYIEEEITADIYMIGDVRDFGVVKIVGIDDWIGFTCVNDKKEIVCHTQMIDDLEYAMRFEFDKIDKEYYNFIIENWEDMECDFYFKD